MAAYLAPFVKQQFFDSNGDPLSGGKIYTYEAGTSTPLATYTDAGGGTPNANPVVLDAAGRANIWMSLSNYKFVVKDSSDATIYTVDNISIAGVPADGTVTNAMLASGAINSLKSSIIRAGFAENLGMALNAGTFSMTGYDGTALSATNPAYITMPSSTDGRLVRLKIEANQTFQDAAHATNSHIIGELFGVVTGIAWDKDRPFYLYAVNGTDADAGLIFGISCNPTLKVSPATANIGYHDNPASSNSFNNMFMLTDTDVTATHNGKPCVLIGGFRMQMNASDDWTVQTLDLSKGDGYRPDPFVGKVFEMVDGQNSAASGSFFVVGGTAPSWATPASIVYNYTIGLDGKCTIFFTTFSAGNCTNGSGGNSMSLVLPYAQSTSEIYIYQSAIQCILGGTSVQKYLASFSANPYFSMTDDFVGNNVVNTDFSNSADDVYCKFTYQAFEVA